MKHSSQMCLDIENEVVPVVSVKEALELAAEFLVHGPAELRQGRKIYVINWVQYSDKPEIIVSRTTNMFRR